MNPIRFWLLFLALSAATILFAGSAFAASKSRPVVKSTKSPLPMKPNVTVEKPIIKVRTASLELRWLLHVPNGGKRDIGTAQKLKLQGVRRGVPAMAGV